MKKKHLKSVPHYLPLLGIFGASVLAFLVFSYDKQFQVGIAVSVAVAHMSWGIVHHYMHGDLSPEIVLEYLAVSALGLAVILTVIFYA